MTHAKSSVVRVEVVARVADPCASFASFGIVSYTRCEFIVLDLAAYFHVCALQVVALQSSDEVERRIAKPTATERHDHDRQHLQRAYATAVGPRC